MTLARLLVRRHLAWTLPWVVFTVGFVAAMTPVYARTDAGPQTRALELAAANHSPALVMLLGHLPSPGNPAQMLSWETGGILILLLAVAAVLLVVRLTRDAETDGTWALIRDCGVSDRRLVMTSLGYVVTVASLIWAGAALAVGLQPGVEGVTWTGSVLLGGTLATTFLLVAGLTAVLAQLWSDPGRVRGVALAVVALAVAARAAGDLRGWHWLSELSPLGLRGLVVPFTEDRWLPLAVALTVAFVVLALAVVLATRREYDAALLPTASARFATVPVTRPARLVVRRASGQVLAWTVALAVTGGFVAAMGDGVVSSAQAGHRSDSLVGSHLTGPDPVDGYFAYLGTILGVVVSVLGILLVLRSWTDERTGLVELTRGCGRPAWWPVATATAVAALGSLLVLAAAAGTTALLAPHVIGSGAGAALHHVLGQWPSVLALSGVTALVVGAAPRFAALAWVPWAVSAIVSVFGRVLDLPQVVVDASAFGHATGAGGVQAAQLVLLVVAVLSAAVGVLAATRRDLST